MARSNANVNTSLSTVAHCSLRKSSTRWRVYVVVVYTNTHHRISTVLLPHVLRTPLHARACTGMGRRWFSRCPIVFSSQSRALLDRTEDSGGRTPCFRVVWHSGVGPTHIQIDSPQLFLESRAYGLCNGDAWVGSLNRTILIAGWWSELKFLLRQNVIFCPYICVCKCFQFFWSSNKKCASSFTWWVGFFHLFIFFFFWDAELWTALFSRKSCVVRFPLSRLFN